MDVTTENFCETCAQDRPFVRPDGPDHGEWCCGHCGEAIFLDPPRAVTGERPMVLAPGRAA